MLRLLLPSIAAFLIALVAITLGNWQTRRGDEKVVLKSQIERGQAMPPIGASEVTTKTHANRRVQIEGEWREDKTIFIDNRTHKGIAGFHVLTPLKMASGKHVLVLRGWVARDLKDRTKLPQLRSLSGTSTRPGTRPGTSTSQVVGLSQPDVPQSYELGKPWVPGAKDFLWQNASREIYSTWSGLALEGFVLRQTESLTGFDDGLVREWAAFNVDEDKHRGYAVQWYSLGALSGVLWVWFVLIKKILKKKK
jgi:surfeit locus 1 family protein